VLSTVAGPAAGLVDGVNLTHNRAGQASFTYPDGQSPGLTYFFVLTKASRQMDIVVNTPGFNIRAVGAEHSGNRLKSRRVVTDALILYASIWGPPPEVVGAGPNPMI
jgi:hypothetical protein